MLVSYVDDSGSHDTSPSYVLSAFYTTPKHWEKILIEWLGMVHRYGVTAFHATDCANGAKEFAGWSKRRKKNMFRNLINILTRHSDLGGCSACVVLKDYEEVVYPEAHQLLEDRRFSHFSSWPSKLRNGRIDPSPSLWINHPKVGEHSTTFSTKLRR